MALTKYKLGDLITLSEEKNSENKYGIGDVKVLQSGRSLLRPKQT